MIDFVLLMIAFCLLTSGAIVKKKGQYCDILASPSNTKSSKTNHHKQLSTLLNHLNPLRSTAYGFETISTGELINTLIQGS